MKEREMKVIMLRGPSSCGKTTILNLVYDTLMNTHNATIHTAKMPLGGNSKDFEAILNYNGKTVSIFTMGDYSIGVTNTMKKYAGFPADVLVIACNDRFKRPMTAINNYPNSIIAKTRQLSANNDQREANNIITLI
jgi:energy-coupling factor transporter ATP-binding protein EcfA2